MNTHILQGSVPENDDSSVVVVNFTITDGDQVSSAAELGDVTLVGQDGQFFTAEITGSVSGRILTK